MKSRIPPQQPLSFNAAVLEPRRQDYLQFLKENEAASVCHTTVI